MKVDEPWTQNMIIISFTLGVCFQLKIFNKSIFSMVLSHKPFVDHN